MIPIIREDDKNLNIDWDYKYVNGIESNTYSATHNNKPSVVKFFINENCIKNKVEKMKLIKERCGNDDFIVTADAFIEEDNKLIGYVMPKIDGINVYEDSYNKSRSPEFLIWYLKELACNLKKLHKLRIINGDFTSNVIVKDKKLFFIDHDNFHIDNLEMDQKNLFLVQYLKERKCIDNNFDFYLLNLYTFSILRNYYMPFIYAIKNTYPETFDFCDSEVKELFEKTITLDKSFNGELIIDKINSKNDLKKIKSKTF